MNLSTLRAHPDGRIVWSYLVGAAAGASIGDACGSEFFISATGAGAAIDISPDAVARIRANAERNGVPHVDAREANVFDELRRLERAGARYDTIVLDPPAFAKNKASVPNALAGYKEINLRAMRLLSPGGCLVTCSCSYNVDEEMLGAVLHEASVDSHTPVTVVEKRMQGRDHPVVLGMPETYYLKCFILRKLS